MITILSQMMAVLTNVRLKKAGFVKVLDLRIVIKQVVIWQMSKFKSLNKLRISMKHHHIWIKSSFSLQLLLKFLTSDLLCLLWSISKNFFETLSWLEIIQINSLLSPSKTKILWFHLTSSIRSLTKNEKKPYMRNQDMIYLLRYIELQKTYFL